MNKSTRHYPKALQDPSRGLAVNTLSTVYKMGSRVYEVDIARTPYVICDDFTRKDIHRKAWNANSHRGLMDEKMHLFKGRG